METKYCVYCGSTENITSDHVPPKSLFPKPRPSDLITVDCCYDCNQKFKLEDEYFKTLLSHSDVVTSHPAGVSLLKKLESMYKREESHPLLMRITDTMTTVNGQPAIMPESDRLIKFLHRVTSGIFNHVTHRILPKDNYFGLLDKSNINRHPDPIKSQMMGLYKYVYNQDKISIGNNVFTYSYYVLEDDPDAFCAYFNFFETLEFLTLSKPKSIEGKQQRIADGIKWKIL